MKLFSKYNRISIASSIAIFLVGWAAFYFVFRYVLLQQLDRTLLTEQTEVIAYVEEYNELPEIVTAYDQEMTFTPVNKSITKSTYKSLEQWDDVEKDFDWVRQVSFGIIVNKKHYNVTITKSQKETEHLLMMILGLAAGMIGLIMLAAYLINFFVLNRFWKPFYHTLSETERFELSNQQPLQLPSTGITEFDLLNGELTKMTTRIRDDYTMLKNFTSNAAHEMQTPLAVIRSNIESLMQDKEMLRKHQKSIGDIESSGNRLARLNKALLLLTRIENRQFELKEIVDLSKLVITKKNEFAELISSQQIQLQTAIKPATVVFHAHLAEVLIDNLLNNAIRYNFKGGVIIISLNESGLRVENSSPIPALDSEKLFQRFYRHEQTIPDGNGLGLSIVKQLCDLGGWALAYDYENDRHVFSIQFLESTAYTNS